MLTEGASAAMPTSILWFTRHDKKISTLIFVGPNTTCLPEAGTFMSWPSQPAYCIKMPITNEIQLRVWEAGQM